MVCIISNASVATCNGHGWCVSGRCICQLYWGNTDCSLDIELLTHHWGFVVWWYFWLVLFFAALIYALFTIDKLKQHSEQADYIGFCYNCLNLPKSPPEKAMALSIISVLGRLVEYFINPYDSLSMRSLSLRIVLNSICLSGLFSAYFIVVRHWIKIFLAKASSSFLPPRAWFVLRLYELSWLTAVVCQLVIAVLRIHLVKTTALADYMDIEHNSRLNTVNSIASGWYLVFSALIAATYGCLVKSILLHASARHAAIVKRTSRYVIGTMAMILLVLTWMAVDWIWVHEGFQLPYLVDLIITNSVSRFVEVVSTLLLVWTVRPVVGTESEEMNKERDPLQSLISSSTETGARTTSIQYPSE